MLKYATTSTSSWNKKLSGQHLFLPFKAANDIAQSTNNNMNQLQTKFYIKNKGIRKDLTMCKSYAIMNDLQNENKMIQNI
jgi:hypothetical protein